MVNSTGNAVIAGNGLSACNQVCLVSFPHRTTRVLRMWAAQWWRSAKRWQNC